MEKIVRPVQRNLNFPWLLAGLSLIPFLLTLNSWVTVSSVSVMAKVGNWDWQPQSSAPLFYLITLPARFLQGNPAFYYVNLVTVILAALTLANLARSVMLLPHDRTREQREREHNEFSLLTIRWWWVPPLLAVLACGLQTSFWQHATAGSGEMLDLLLFSYLVRCLLTFRIEHQQKWADRFALFYGLGITNNWALFPFAPLFLLAILWIKQVSFFDFRFLSRLVLFFLLGLLAYLILPIAGLITSDNSTSFWESLLNTWRNQKFFFYDLPMKFDPSIRNRLLLMSLTSLLPVVIMSVRWPATFGDISAAGSALTNFMFRAIHLVFFLLCLLVSFDLWFSPRALGKDAAVTLTFLSFYLLSALCVGYFSGYLLLIFSKPRGKAWKRPSPLTQAAGVVVVALVLAMVVILPGGLLYRNYPVIRQVNGPLLKEFGINLAKALPAQTSVVMSDDPLRLYLLRAALAIEKSKPAHVFVDTTALTRPDYHRHLAQKHPQIWPALAANASSIGEIQQVHLQQMLSLLASQQQVFYLHPSFGYLFEQNFLIPEGSVYRVQPFGPNELLPSRLAPELIQKNETYWQGLKSGTFSTLDRLSHEKVPDLNLLSTYYSRSVNYWGAAAQKNQRLKEAGVWFEEALRLNTNNVVADVNRLYNARLQKGQSKPIDPSKSIEERMLLYRNWQNIFTINGPFDEPIFCLEVSQLFSRGNLFRQSLIEAHRSFELSSNSLASRILLANAYMQNRQPDMTINLVAETRRVPTDPPLSASSRLELLRLEAWASLFKNDFPAGEKILKKAVDDTRYDPDHVNILIQYYITAQRLTNALDLVNDQLQKEPDNANALLNKAAFHIQFGEFDQALAPLNRLLAAQPDHSGAMLNRAITYLQKGDLEAARKDYETLEKTLPDPAYQVFYGLGEIAYRKKEVKEALRRYETYLQYAPPNTSEADKIRGRIDELKKGGKK